MTALLSAWHVRLCMFVAVLISVPLYAAESEQRKVVDGISIYLGVLPAEMLLGPQLDSAAHEMHGGIPAGLYRYHVMVAVFDARTGLRIGNAQVRVRVYEAAQNGFQKKLEPMLVQGTVTYGEYFSMPTSGPYKIEVEVIQPGKTAPVKAVFVYRFGQA